MDRERVIPRLFHRRLVLLAGVMTAAMLALTTQLTRLSVVKGAALREKAETMLRRETLLPTFRGSMVDRLGRKLALDRPGYAIAVDYDVITGDWEIARSRRQARGELGRARWDTLGEVARTNVSRRFLPEWQARTERLWQAIRLYGDIDRTELARRREEIRHDVERLAADVWLIQEARLIAEYGDDEAPFKRSPIHEEQAAHVVLPAVEDDVAFAFRAMAGDLPDVYEVQDARRRDYPELSRVISVDRASLPRPLASDAPLTVKVVGVADHILGAVNAARAEDVARRPFRDPKTGRIDRKGYRRVGDVAGRRGLERSFEDHLRGTRGQVSRRLDSGEVIRADPVYGGDLALTLDIALQARVQALLSDEIGLTLVQPFHDNHALPLGWPLNSSVVVVEIETGEILSMVSSPTRADGAALRRVDLERALADQSYINRPVEGAYPPGSVIKPIVLAAAGSEGVIALDEPIECTGHYFPHLKDRARCWIYRERWDFATHGSVVADAAIARSCNIFFYTLGERLGAAGMVDWYRQFGLGQPLDVGLLYAVRDAKTGDTRRRGEYGGSLLSDETAAGMTGAGHLFNTIIMAIGQGPGATWTPLQAANAYATLARGGTVRDATLLLDDPRGTRAVRGEDLPLDPAVVETVLDGLRHAVAVGGTTHHLTYGPGDTEDIFTAEGVVIWGKSGTAQAPPLYTKDTNADGALNSKDGKGITGVDHAWFVGLVGPADSGLPMFAIAVLVEYGGSGGRVAGPIANQVIMALQHEGYLPGGSFAFASGESR